VAGVKAGSAFDETAFVFDTAVGFGEFGETQPREAAKEKWQNAYGIIQVVHDTDTGVQVMFSVIPKFVVDPDNIKKFLIVKPSD
jgi:hypothetical protein